MATRRRGKRGSVPALMKHSSGQARVCLSGQVFYLGAYGSAEAAEKYAELVKRWEAGGRKPLRRVAEVPSAGPLSELFADWEDYLDATGRYRKNGSETSQRGLVRVAVREFCSRFGKVRVVSYSERLLLQHRDALEANSELSRGGINRKIGILRAALKWAFQRGVISRDQWLGTKAVEPLTRAEAGIRGRQVTKRAVTWAEVERVAACLPRVTASMLRLQALTGMRPGEVCGMRWCDIDRNGEVFDGVRCWIYTVPEAKTSHHGHATTYPLGPAAQHLLAGFSMQSPSAHVFSPANSMKELSALRRAERKTSVTAYTAQRDASATRRFHSRYSTADYRQAVERACERAGVERFTPHEVRHGFITRAAQLFGAYAAASAANHRRVSTTESYVHRRREDALRVVIGLEGLSAPDDRPHTSASRSTP